MNEVSFLGRLHHPNLVWLIGYCAQLTKLKEERLLVYEFVLHGSLDNLLFQTSDFWLPMPWNRRVDVAIDAARGLAFLHDHQVSHDKLIVGAYCLAVRAHPALTPIGLYRLVAIKPNAL